jgi:pimeloyl-ACP methyl ester carboxylesterase
VPQAEVNGVGLYYELHGDGDPLVLVHGSWADATAWALVLPGLAEAFRVLVYDRRGHSRSERPDSPGSVAEDGDDLAALMEALELAPAHVVATSFGGNIALALALRRPELFLSLSCHEPPLWGLLANDPQGQEMLARSGASLESVARRIARGDHEGAARQFVNEVAWGPDAWETQVPAAAKEVMVRNAPTFLDELQHPDHVTVDEDAVARLDVPLRLTGGTDSAPVFGRTLDRLAGLAPHATRTTIDGAAHAPHVTTPERYVEETVRGVRRLAG